MVGIGPKTAAELINKFGSPRRAAGRGAARSKESGARPSSRRASRFASRASWSRCATTCRCRRPWPSCSGSIPISSAWAGCSVSWSSRAWSSSWRRSTGENAASAAPSRWPAPAPVAPAPRPEPPRPASTRIRRPRGRSAELAGRADRSGGGGRDSALWTTGVSAVRGNLVGLALRAARAGRPALYLPFHHRYLGAPACLPEAALAELAAVLASPAIAKHAHDVKTLEVLLAQRGLALGGVASDPMLAAYLLDAARTHYDLDVVATSEGISPPAAARAAGWGRAPRPARRGHVRRGGRPAPGRRGRRVAGAGREAGAATCRRRPRRPLPRAGAAAGRRAGRASSAAASCSTSTSCASWATRSARRSSRWRRRSTPSPARPSTSARTKQLADVLFGKLELPVVRRTKTGPSTDADVLEELAALHPVPAKIVEYRTLSKLKGTYIDALPALVEPGAPAACTPRSTRPSPPPGGCRRAIPTCRTSPSAPSWAAASASAFVAKPGHLLVSADYSQIELRILAHFSRGSGVAGGVPHGPGHPPAHGGARCSACRRTAVTGEQRRIAKAINFGLVFGQSDFGLAQVLRIPRAEARAVHRRATSSATPACARTWSGPSPTRARRRRWHAARAGGGRCPRSAPRARRTAAHAERIAAQHAHPGHRRRSLEAGDDPRRRGRLAGRGAPGGAALLLHRARRAGVRGPRTRRRRIQAWVKNEMEVGVRAAGSAGRGCGGRSDVGRGALSRRRHNGSAIRGARMASVMV